MKQDDSILKRKTYGVYSISYTKKLNRFKRDSVGTKQEMQHWASSSVQRPIQNIRNSMSIVITADCNSTSGNYAMTACYKTVQSEIPNTYSSILPRKKKS